MLRPLPLQLQGLRVDLFVSVAAGAWCPALMFCWCSFPFFLLLLLLHLLLLSVCPVSACLSSLCQRGSCLSRRSAVYSRKRHDHTSSLVQCMSSDCAYAKRLCKSFRCHGCIALCLRLLAVIESVSASLCTVDSAIVIVVEALCPRYTKDSAKRPT